MCHVPAEDKYKTKWTRPGSIQWHITDFVLDLRRYVHNVCNVCVIQRAEFCNDHSLNHTEMKFVIKLKVRPNSMTIPKKLNVTRLKDEAIKEELVKRMDDI
ncbi:Hypothetical predicted protein [Octopus vulgaris]|uniref:Uncharacterized protein n=1 Tax=Octopus vulgaris TaxID=6645 RepID=A0AA36APB6_OCTVU|nr:Hypothetical predicted protein [Octopus vulgaris]